MTDYTYDGGGVDPSVWNDDDNWGAGGPGEYPDDNGDKAIINSTNNSITVPASLTVGEITVGGTYGGVISCAGSLVVDDAGAHNGNLTVDEGTFQTAKDTAGPVTVDGTLSIGANGTFVCRRKSMTGNGEGQTISCGTLTVTGDMNADGQGFDTQDGPGYDGNNYGGTHGGVGGFGGSAEDYNNQPTYGSMTNPTSLGSGGQNNAGGGAIVIDCTGGTVTVNGTLSADSQTGGGEDGGAGGSVNITAATLAGTGTIRANATLETNSLGGGGRIGLNGVTSQTFSGTIEAKGAGGGSNRKRGYAGTVYLNPARRTNLTIASGETLRLGTDDQASYTFGAVVVQSGGVLEVDGNPNLNGRQGRGATLNVDSLDVQSGGELRADGLGFPRARGPGFTLAKGGTYGGQGNEAAVDTYGSLNDPTEMGSGGDAGGAGGCIIVVSSGTVAVGGTVSADAEASGTDETSAGGCVNIRCTTISGAGTIRARGGTAVVNKEAGGGGRIAVRLSSGTTFGTITFQAFGGAGSTKPGAAGTLYREKSTDASGKGGLVIDNNSVDASPYNTEISPTMTDASVGDVTIQNAGILGMSDNGVILCCAGDWTNNGTQTMTAGKVKFDGSAAQTITSGGDKFFNVEVVNTSGGGVIFDDLVHIDGELIATVTSASVLIKFDETAAHDIHEFSFTGSNLWRVQLRSQSDGNQWDVASAVTKTVDHVDVKDSNLSGATVTVVSGTDSGNNSSNWVFPAVPVRNAGRLFVIGVLD